MDPRRVIIPATRGLVGLSPTAEEEKQLYLFINGNMSPGDLKTTAVTLLGCAKLLQMVLRLQSGDQARFVDRADRALPVIGPEVVKSIVCLGAVCSGTGRLPGSAVLSTGLEKLDDAPVTSTGLTDTHRGMHGHRPVFMESFRNYSPQLFKGLKEILFKWIPIFMRLSHPNILQFRGANTTIFQLALVYDWVESRNIVEYTAVHPGAPRIPLLLQIAQGLHYLHSVDVVHGDLTVINVLVDQAGRVRLARYGLGSIKRSPSLTARAGPRAVDGLLAPEIVNAIGPPITESKPADIFSFSMLAIEVLTSTPPFCDGSPAVTARLISEGARPEFPRGIDSAVGLTTQIQDLLRGCWHRNPAKRPTIDIVVHTLSREHEATPCKLPSTHRSAATTQARPTEPSEHPRGTTARRRGWLCGL